MVKYKLMKFLIIALAFLTFSAYAVKNTLPRPIGEGYADSEASTNEVFAVGAISENFVFDSIFCFVLLWGDCMLSETVLLTIGLGCVAALLVVALFARIRRKLSSFSKVPLVLKIVLLLCGVSFYLHGSLKTNNTTNAASTMMFAARPSVQTTDFIDQTEIYVNCLGIVVGNPITRTDYMVLSSIS